MITKLFEIRDSLTFIPCVATSLNADPASPESYLIRRCGFGPESDEVLLVNLIRLDGHYDPQRWGSERTMTTAHKYIRENWQKLKSGDVVDVEYILGETPEPKKSEREDQGSLWRGVYGGL